jgi:outer membrane lipoprotein-sorting protein
MQVHACRRSLPQRTAPLSTNSLTLTPLALLAAVLLTLAPAASQETAESPAPLDAHAVIKHMAERNPTLQSYKARVHVDIRMSSFPYLAPKLDGTSYYKRPDFFIVVFDRMPSYARSFGRLFNDIGNPLAWQRDQNITVDGTTSLDGRPTIVLRLTKKIHSDILDHTLAYVDEASFVLVRMEWYYTSGGKIAMTQQYRADGSYFVVSRQHATIQIPHVRAVADAVYGTYQTNVPVDAAKLAP